RDAIARVQPGQDELDTRRPHRLALRGVDLEGLLPGPRHALEAIGVVRAGQHVADLDLHALGEDLRNLVQAALFDVLGEHRLDRLGDDGVEYLPFGHLLTAHHVQLELAQRRGIEMPQVADPWHGWLLTQPYRPVPGAGDHGAIVGNREAST